jgi:hypothetical protein
VKRPCALIAVAVALVVTLTIGACGGGDDGTTTTSAPPPDGVEAPRESTPPASATGDLPPGFVECMAEQGYEIKSSADIHSAPPPVLQACFGSSHGGGGVP